MFQSSAIWFPSWEYPIFPYFSLIKLSMFSLINLFVFLADFHVSILGDMVSILGVSNHSIFLADQSFHISRATGGYGGGP